MIYPYFTHTLFYLLKAHSVRREGCQARSKAPDSESGLVGVRAFESLPSHNY